VGRAMIVALLFFFLFVAFWPFVVVVLKGKKYPLRFWYLMGHGMME
jgi:phosphate starvation-inducible membrane PsiE